MLTRLPPRLRDLHICTVRRLLKHAIAVASVKIGTGATSWLSLALLFYLIVGRMRMHNP